MTELAVEEAINEHAMQFINRVSDLLFVLARAANDKGKADILWVPGGNI
jgi:cob(I)alamin adenosyltransferase